MSPPPSANERDTTELDELRARLREAEETLEAIRNGDVDALVVSGPGGQQVYTLENADRPYRALIEQMQEGAITLGADAVVLYCNERLAKMLEAPRERLIGAKFSDFMSGEDLKTFQHLFAADREEKATDELSLTTATGVLVPVNLSLADVAVDEGMPTITCGVVTDLSLVRKRADELASANSRLAGEIEERKRAQGSLQLALDAAKMGSWDLDLQGGDATRSLRHDNIFGYPKLQPTWSLATLIAHIVPEDRDAVAAAFRDGHHSGRVDIEARIRRADDGAVVWLHFTGQTFYEDTRAIRIAGVVSDVTDRRAIEERLRQAQKLEAVGQLTGGIAHDFNNLLMVISGGLEMFDRQKDPARRERILSGMRQAVTRGSSLSSQLLAFSRKQPLRAQPISLARQVAGMQELLDRSLRGDVQVKFAFPDNLWPVEVDPGEFELVLLNLAVNARDAMPNGGAITISASNLSGYASEDHTGDFVRLVVADTGTGMPPAVMARVFEPFFTTKDVDRGSGLGLAQTHGFARSSGGEVRVTSVLGKGTEVSLFLPRSFKAPLDEVQEHLDAPSDRRQSSASAGEVLVVEDDDEVAALTKDMFEHLGFEVMRVAGAEAALGALADHRTINLLFSDIMMPGTMNGVELAREVRKRRPDLPMLLTSGYPEAAQYQAKANNLVILPKPFRLEELKQVLAKVLPLSGSS